MTQIPKNRPFRREDVVKKRRPHWRKKKEQNNDQMGPKNFPNPNPYKQKGVEWNWEGVNAQEYGTSGTGNLLWEYKSTFHWAVVINKTGQQGEIVGG